MKGTVRGYIDFFQWLGYAALLVVLLAYGVTRLLIGIFFWVLIFIVILIFKWSRLIQSNRGRRGLVRFLRVMPFGKAWRRTTKKGRIVIRRPFAIDLHEISPVCFVGMSRSEISAILKSSVDQESAERGTAEVTWNCKDFHIECWFEEQICRGCSFYTKDVRGKLAKISDTY